MTVPTIRLATAIAVESALPTESAAARDTYGRLYGEATANLDALPPWREILTSFEARSGAVATITDRIGIPDFADPLVYGDVVEVITAVWVTLRHAEGATGPPPRAWTLVPAVMAALDTLGKIADVVESYDPAPWERADMPVFVADLRIHTIGVDPENTIELLTTMLGGSGPMTITGPSRQPSTFMWVDLPTEATFARDLADDNPPVTEADRAAKIDALGGSLDTISQFEAERQAVREEPCPDCGLDPEDDTMHLDDCPRRETCAVIGPPWIPLADAHPNAEWLGDGNWTTEAHAAHMRTAHG